MKRAIIIPARLQAKRLPRKPMLLAGNKTLLQWTWELAAKVSPDLLLVASPDEEILAAVEHWGGRAVYTDERHPSGSHRSAQAAAELGFNTDQSLVLSLQADEPLLESRLLELLFDVAEEEEYPICTAVAAIESESEIKNTNLVKAAYSKDRCWWFSRQPISRFGHIGVYLFRGDVLADLAAESPSQLSRSESLEQLTWIEHGWPVYAVEADCLPLSINTPYDFEIFRRVVEGKAVTH